MSQTTSVYGSIYIKLPNNLSIDKLIESFKEFVHSCSIFEEKYGKCPWIIEDIETIEPEAQSQAGDETPYVKWLQIIICGFIIPNNVTIIDYGLDYETTGAIMLHGEFSMDGHLLKVVTDEFELAYELTKCETIDKLKLHISQEYENVSYMRISEKKYNEMVTKITKYEELLKQYNLL